MNQNYLFACLMMVIAFVLTACTPETPPPVALPTLDTPTIAPPEPTLIVATEVAEAEPTAVPPTAEPPPAPTEAAVPTFSDLQFTDRADFAASNTVFVAPNEVFALWRYDGMQDGDIVQRDWYFDGALFISREEIWDLAAYGSTGTRTDVSIFDYETGLQPGVYRVVLSINGQQQLEGTFNIEPAVIPTDDVDQPESSLTDLYFSLSADEQQRFSLFDNASEVFAIISYENMSQGDVFKRDWYLNGRLLVSREENWDFTMYGDSGTRTDISLFDFEEGLTFGNYRLVLSVNGEKQIERRFDVRDAAVGYVPTQISLFGFSTTPTDAPGSNLFEDPEEIFAIMNYSDMKEGDVVQREWFFNEAPFLSREETWDMAQYGESGIRKDISIFDYEDGLARGEYRLLVLVNGQYQGDVTFEIVPLQTIAPLTEAMSGRVAETIDENTIVVTNPDGTTQTYVSEGRVVHLDWFLSGDKLIYASQIVIDPNAFPVFGRAHEVWVINLNNGTTHQLSTVEDNLHHPLVSPTGDAVAFLRGEGYGDACYVGLDLLIMLVDDMGFETSRITPLSFPSIQADQGDQGYTTNALNFDGSYESRAAGLTSLGQASPGKWLDKETFESNIGWNSCVEPYGGLYELDIVELSATLIEPLVP
ncbi:MAG: hypothetical protein QNJ45_19035 [Ardenticatenaceae bacterium]|nr:hypothetical protein [Ardenticatenaceae bacterium]